MNYVQERLIGGPFFADASLGSATSVQQTLESPIGKIGGDSVNVLRRPMSNFVSGGALSIFSQVIAAMQQLLSSLGLNSQASGAQSYFKNVTASSSGDPHLAIDGTDNQGNAHHARFDSMNGHNDLLDSASFAGGYRIATQVTAPQANGVTFNREASVSTNFGNTRVSLDNAGHAEIFSDGQAVSVANGQTIDLGNGEAVARTSDGSLVITDRNAFGGMITTRLSKNGAGVDVNVQAQNLELGGDLVNASTPVERVRRQELAQ